MVTKQAIKKASRWKKTEQYVHRSTSTQGNGANELWYTIPYRLQYNDTRNMSIVHTYTQERRLRREKKQRNRKEKKNPRKMKATKKSSGRRPSPEGQGCCLLVRSIICHVKLNGPTEGRHETSAHSSIISGALVRQTCRNSILS